MAGAEVRLGRRRGGRGRQALVACLLGGAAAFDMEGHDAIGQTAASAMDQEAMRQVKRLLGGQDTSDVAGWGHQADDTFPGLTKLHYQTHDDSSGQHCKADQRKAKCDNNMCLLSAIKHFYGKILKDEGRKIDFPDLVYNDVHEGLKFSDADAVKMLINLLGDLHQPLHVGYVGDDLGRAVKVKFRGKETTLYELWDKGIGEVIRTEQSGFWYGGWTHVRGITHEWEDDKEYWKKEGAFKSFDRWYAETAEFACKEVYKHPTTGKLFAGEGVNKDEVFEIDDAAYQEWNKAWLRQILLAGERTAIVLNDILDASGAKKLDSRTQVETDADKAKKAEYAKLEEDRKKNPKIGDTTRTRLAPARINIPVLLTNLGIACFTVPLFLVVVNYGLNPQVWLATAMAILEPAPSGGAQGGGSGRGKRVE